MTILVTGAAGFIGYHVCNKLSESGDKIIGIDNLNDYYDVNLKNDRLKNLSQFNNFKFLKIDISNREKISELFYKYKIKKVIHLAAQAGVRYSIKNPYAYIESNITGFINILEGSRNNNIEHLVYASSSSVYGANKTIPFKESDNVDHPVSLYAATKKSNELMAHSYSSLFNLPTTGLRFFTVYGPWGRPDMSPMLFADAIINQRPIKVFNYGKHKRDFTYIDDIVDGIIGVLHKPPTRNKTWSGYDPESDSSYAPWQIFNIGNNKPIELLDYIRYIEKEIGKETSKELLPIQQGDVEHTYADVDRLAKFINYRPSTYIEDGIKKFIEWYKNYYNIK